MCCVTLRKRALNDLLYFPRPSFVIPIFRAPTTSPTIRASLLSTGTTTITTNKILSTLLKQEPRLFNPSRTTAESMVNQRIFENLVLTNTIVAAFCIVLMVTITGFLIFLLVPSIRRRWLNDRPGEGRKLDELPTLSRQPSMHHFTLGPSRFNPIFEPAAGATTTTTQFGTLFQPHAATTTLLHPTIWTPITPTSVVSTPIPTQQQLPIVSTPPTSIRAKPTPPATTSGSATSTTAAARPPLPAHPPTTIQRSLRKR